MKYTIFLPDDTLVEVEGDSKPEVGDSIRIIVEGSVRTYVVHEACWEVKTTVAGRVKGELTYKSTIVFVLVLKEPE